jgi:hypothetical protein
VQAVRDEDVDGVDCPGRGAPQAVELGSRRIIYQVGDHAMFLIDQSGRELRDVIGGAVDAVLPSATAKAIGVETRIDAVHAFDPRRSGAPSAGRLEPAQQCGQVRRAVAGRAVARHGRTGRSRSASRTPGQGIAAEFLPRVFEPIALVAEVGRLASLPGER